MSLHEQSVGVTDEWYTPPSIFKALGCRFDMDVAHPGLPDAAWIPADRYICSASLTSPWDGFIWMNPPFGPRNGIAPWLERFVNHADGICLVPDRTSAPWWQKYVQAMDLILFVSPKIRFISADGSEGKSPAQGTCLMSIGNRGRTALKCARSAGAGVLMTLDR